jgi:hypothetical protein
LQNVADLACRDAAQKGLADQLSNGGLAALIARQNLRAKTFAGTWNADTGQAAELGEEVAKVVAIAIVQTAQWSVLVIIQL